MLFKLRLPVYFVFLAFSGCNICNPNQNGFFWGLNRDKYRKGRFIIVSNTDELGAWIPNEKEAGFFLPCTFAFSTSSRSSKFAPPTIIYEMKLLKKADFRSVGVGETNEEVKNHQDYQNKRHNNRQSTKFSKSFHIFNIKWMVSSDMISTSY